MIHANSWCYRCLLDARPAAGRYLRAFGADMADIASIYEELSALLLEGAATLPSEGDSWSAQARSMQADTLERGLVLERQAVSAIESLLTAS